MIIKVIGYYTNNVVEKNQRFRCDDCGKEVYGKLVKYKYSCGLKKICLKCFIKRYNRIEENVDSMGKKKEISDIIKRVKEKLEEDLIIDEI